VIYGRCYPGFYRTNQFLCIILNVIQYLSHGFPVNNLVNFITIIRYGYMHSIGITEKVVQIAQYLLICPYQKYTQVIGFLGLNGMNRQII